MLALDLIGWIIQLVRDVEPAVRILLAGFAMFCETSILLGVIVPGDTVTLISATGVRNPAEYAGLLVAVIIGSLAGESLGYYIGQWFGRHIRHSKTGQKLGESNWMRAERFLERHGGFAIFVSRFLPVFHSLIPVTVGMSHITYRRFLAWTTPACLIWATAYTGVGALAGTSYQELSKRLSGAAFIFVGIIAAFAIIVWISKKLLSRAVNRRIHDDIDPATITANGAYRYEAGTVTSRANAERDLPAHRPAVKD